MNQKTILLISTLHIALLCGVGSQVANANSPATPGILKTSLVSCNGFFISLSTNYYSAAVSHYEIFLNDAFKTTIPGAWDQHVAGLAPGVAYKVTVRAVGTDGLVSAFSAPAWITTLSEIDTEPPEINDLHLYRVTENYITLAWHRPRDNSGVISFFEIYENNQLKGKYLPPPYPETDMEYIDIGTTPNTSYTFSYRVSDGAGNWSKMSNTVACVGLPQSGDTEWPENLDDPYPYMTNLTSTSFTLHWGVPYDNVGVVAFILRLRGSGTCVLMPIEIPSTTTSWTFNNLDPETDYDCFLYARDKAGNLSGEFFDVFRTLPDTEPPSKPQNLRFADIIDNRVVISWDRATDNHSVKEYQVKRQGITLKTVTQGQDKNACFFIDDAPLSTGCSYTVTAFDFSRNSSTTSNEVTVIRSSPPVWWPYMDIVILGGNAQTGSPNAFLNAPFKVKIEGPWSEGLPVTFTIISGAGSLYENKSDLGHNEVTILSHTGGLAEVWFKQSDQYDTQSQIRVSCAGKQVIITATTTSNPNGGGNGNDGGGTGGNPGAVVPEGFAAWAVSHGIDPNDPHGDADGDGLTNLEEFLYNCNPKVPDTPILFLEIFTPTRK